MSFKPEQLSPTVYEAYKKGPMAWIYVVRLAIEEGCRDLGTLASIAFFLHHPELKGRKLKVGEQELITQWKGFQTFIKLFLRPDHRGRAATDDVWVDGKIITSEGY